jgi:hypothetical protein
MPIQKGLHMRNRHMYHLSYRHVLKHTCYYKKPSSAQSLVFIRYFPPMSYILGKMLYLIPMTFVTSLI